MTFALAILCAIAYAQTGYQLGKKGAKVWKKKDQRSLASLTFFPVSRFRRKVGHGTPFGDDATYTFFMTFLWPLFLGFNALAVGAFIGPDLLFTKTVKALKTPAYQRKMARLRLENARLDRTIRRLEATDAGPPVPLLAVPAAEEPRLPEAAERRPAPPAFEPPPPQPPPPLPVRVQVEIGITARAQTDADRDEARTDPPPLPERARLVH